MQFENNASNHSLNHTLERFFAGLSEYAFHSQLGVADTELVNYVSKLLVRFTKTDALHRIRQLNGQRATEVVTMMTEAQHRIGLAKREVHRHIGDFTLFWTGLYPESLRGLQGPDRSDQFVSYCHQGKMAYEIASEIEADEAAQHVRGVQEPVRKRALVLGATRDACGVNCRLSLLSGLARTCARSGAFTGARRLYRSRCI